MSFRYGTAYLDVVPQIAKNAFGNVESAMSRALDGPAAKAGEEAGEKAAKGFGSKFGDKVKSLAGPAMVAGGAALGAGLVGGLLGGMSREASSDKLAASLGIIDPKFADELGRAAGDLYAQNFGDSVEQTTSAIGQVIQNNLIPDDFEGDYTKAVQNVTGKALNLASVFDQDVGGMAQAASQLIKTGLVKNADEAFDVITKGFQQGVDKRGDFLDTLNEYSTQFRKLGINAEDATGLLSQGLRGGARDADLVADSLKEFSIRAIDGSKLTAQGFEAVGLNAGEMTAKIAKGGPEAKAGLQQVLDGLRGVEDPAKRAQAATALFGTQAEDLGAALFKLDPSKAVVGLGQVAGAADKLGAQIGDNASAKIETFKRAATQAFVNLLGDKILPIAEKTVEWLGKNKQLIGAIAIGITVAAIPALIAWATSASTAAAASAALSTAMGLIPVVALGIAVAALAYLVIKHWDSIKKAIGTAIDGAKWAIGGLIDTFKKIPGWIADALSKVAGIITAPYRAAFNAIAKLWNNTVGKLHFKVPGWIPGIGGKGFDVPDIPILHGGGMYHAPAGQTEGLALLQDGELVVAANGGRGSTSTLGDLTGGGGWQFGDIKVDARGDADPWRTGRTINRTLRELAFALGDVT